MPNENLSDNHDRQADDVRGDANKLIDETSPYLLQHAYNPVDWHPWGEEALERARQEDKPIFLSIGYSACHWCHVMEHESFQDDRIAGLMNAHFINIKVDREERPDLDEIYMNAVMAMTGNGGWPMSVFLTPTLKPFYGGTYFPPRGRYGMPGFGEVLEQIALVWRTDRNKATQSAEQFYRRLEEQLTASPAPTERLSSTMRENAAKMLESAYDQAYGGWGGAPKFPSPASIGLLLREHGRTQNGFLLEMAVNTLTKMACGGIYDHLGGGFHRYSVDEFWRVPHFEKMLYDNAQLAAVYTEAWQATRNPLFRKVAEETLRYVMRDMQHEAGGFYASEDADSEGEEGRYYLWSRDEICACLGKEAGEAFCAVYNVEDEGNFSSHEPYHRGKNILFLNDREMICNDRTSDLFAASRQRLMDARAGRVRPALDDKIITAWNGLMITAFAKAAFTWDDVAFETAAVRAGTFVREHLLTEEGMLLRTWRCGRSRFPGCLDDYAFTSNAFIDLYECTGDTSWLEQAKNLAASMVKRFYDEKNGGFYTTEAGRADLLVRTKSWHDTAEPAGNAMAAKALFRLGYFYDDDQMKERAERALTPVAPMAVRAPLGFLNTVLASDYRIDGPVEVVFNGTPDDPAIQPLKQVLAESFVPCRVVAWATGSDTIAKLPMTASKPLTPDAGRVYVCRRQTCLPPDSTPEAFRKHLEDG